MSKVAIDIGNTNIVLAVCKDDVWMPMLRMESSTSSTIANYENQVLAHFLEENIVISEFESVIVSSVVPELTDKIKELVDQLFGLTPIVLDGKLIAQLNLGEADPYELGADLAANAIGAFDRYQSAVIVVDFGTALTFTSVDDQGKILGVSIAPGVRTAMQSLSTNTAKLPEIPLEIPDKVIGTDTVSALQAGIMQGYVGMVRHMVQKTSEEMGLSPKVIATGGLSFIFKPLHDLFDDIDVHLTINGLLSISNQSKN